MSCMVLFGKLSPKTSWNIRMTFRETKSIWSVWQHICAEQTIPRRIMICTSQMSMVNRAQQERHALPVVKDNQIYIHIAIKISLQNDDNVTSFTLTGFLSRWREATTGHISGSIYRILIANNGLNRNCQIYQYHSAIPLQKHAPKKKTGRLWSQQQRHSKNPL